MLGEEDEEDYVALIYRESQLRKAEAAVAAAVVAAKRTKKKKKKDSSADASSTRRHDSSTRANSADVNIAQKTYTLMRKEEDEEQTRRKQAARKRNRKICSADGCTDIGSCQGGVCIKHGAKIKRWSSKGRRSVHQTWSKGQAMQK
jgi:hypothetical protein